MTSFSDAVTRRDQEPAAVDPLTMEVIDLATIPHVDLVEVFQRLETYERRAKAWRTAVEDELVRRHGDRKAAQVVGAHEVDVDRGYSRVWDADDLAGVLQYLEDEGLLKRAECAGLIRRVEELKVDGIKAKRLIDHADGDVLIELSRCFTWQQKGRAKVKVTPVAQLEP